MISFTIMCPSPFFFFFFSCTRSLNNLVLINIVHWTNVLSIGWSKNKIQNTNTDTSYGPLSVNICRDWLYLSPSLEMTPENPWKLQTFWLKQLVPTAQFHCSNSCYNGHQSAFFDILAELSQIIVDLFFFLFVSVTSVEKWTFWFLFNMILRWN